MPIHHRSLGRTVYLVAHNTVVPGTISWGTLKIEDLMQAFADEIDRLTATYPSILHEAREFLAGTHEEQDEEGVAEAIIADMIDWFNAQCPAELFFGTLAGDGADFGFWEVDPEDADDWFLDDPDEDENSPDPDDVDRNEL